MLRSDFLSSSDDLPKCVQLWHIVSDDGVGRINLYSAITDHNIEFIGDIRGRRSTGWHLAQFTVYDHFNLQVRCAINILQMRTSIDFLLGAC